MFALASVDGSRRLTDRPARDERREAFNIRSLTNPNTGLVVRGFLVRQASSFLKLYHPPHSRKRMKTLTPRFGGPEVSGLYVRRGDW